MRISAKYLTGLLALGLSMGGTAASAVEPSGISPPITNTAWLFQGEPARLAQPESVGQKAATWLRIADQAMQKGDWENAAVAIGNAERLEQQMPANEPPLSYRPADARRKLETMRGQTGVNQSNQQLQLPPLNGDQSAQGKKDQASRLLAQAQAALDRNDVDAAARLTQQARDLRVPDDQFLPNETLPWQMDFKVRSALRNRGVAQANYEGNGGGQVQQSVYRPQDDPNQFRTVSSEGQDANPYTSGYRGTIDNPQVRSNELLELARRAMANNNALAAREYYTQVMRMADQLDPQTRRYAEDQLAQLQTPNRFPTQDRETGIEEIDDQQRLLLQRIGQDIFRERAVAERMVANRDPRGALQHLLELRDSIARAEIDQASLQHYLGIVDREIREMEQYIERNMVQIQNDETNESRLQDVQNRRAHRASMETQLSALIEDFNMLVDEGRFAEAEVIARQAYELAPNYPEVEVITWKSRFLNRMKQMNAIRDKKEENFWAAMRDVEDSSTPFPDSQPILFGDANTWEEMTERRLRQMGDGGMRSAADMQIIQTLKTTQVNLKFDETPLSDVLRTLSTQANVNIDMDTAVMLDEGVSSEAPISIDLPNSVSLESALFHILGKVNLTYEVRNEVVRVTTHEMKSQNVFRRTYYVGDLVIPIPNFVPSYNMGLPSAIANAYRTAASARQPTGALPAFAGAGGVGGSNVSAVAMAQNLPDFPLNNGIGMGGGNGPVAGMNPGGMGYGPGGMGGGIVADFDSLIDLITNTIAVDSWDEVGGPGHIEPFRANLSLVISQTQEVHEQIQDLLDQLRRLQDLQITIEVRFITLQDDFFERIGVDFDFDIRHGQQVPQDGNGNFLLPTAGPPSLTVGRQPISNLFNPTADLDLKFTQDSFASAVPQFGGFDPNTAANFGFAILSDIEVFMLIQASKGDTRTNILQAPKVTMFNGQTASVNDTSQRPFVTSIIPVVGDFAAAQQPVIVVLNEGTQLSVQAVTSRDRRFVRMTLVPFFSQIGDVEEFTFEGQETTTTGSAVVDPTNPNQTLQDNQVITRSGTTVQLPVFGFTSVSTTVSVPDGGTVLLGGIKRLQEGRNERGVPVLSNVPYVNRLFKNVGIGRTSQSLMMMVTPRIIIQEEEEISQVGAPGN